MSCGMSTVNDILDVTHIKKQFVYYLFSSYNLHLKHEDKWLLSAMFTDMNFLYSKTLNFFICMEMSCDGTSNWTVTFWGESITLGWAVPFRNY